MEAFKKGQFRSVRAAAKSYDIPRSTLQLRLQGHPSRDNSIPNNRKLTSTEESALIEWIQSMDQRGLPLRATLVRQMADLLLAKRTTLTSSPPSTVSQNWVQNFTKRHNEINLKYFRKYDYQRAKCKDPKIIRDWFYLVRNTIAKWGIADKDIYNFNKTGFAMGVTITAKVITSSE